MYVMNILKQLEILLPLSELNKKELQNMNTSIEKKIDVRVTRNRKIKLKLLGKTVSIFTGLQKTVNLFLF